MNNALELMTGVSLAACAGMRAWLPLLIAGLLARFGYLPLNHQFSFIASDGALIVFGILSVLEFMGDKVIAVDHLLDVVGTFVRPAAGAVLASSTLTGMDPAVASALGLVLGGGAALTVHSGKAAVRVKATAMAPLHVGLGNAGISTIEDLLASGGAFLAVFHPAIAFCFAILGMLFAACMVALFIHTGKKLAELFRRGRAGIKATRSPSTGQ